MTRTSLAALIVLCASGCASAQVLFPDVPAPSSEVRAKITVNASSPESLTLLLHASPDARLDDQGTYYALRLSAPALENEGVNASLSLIARTASGLTILGQTSALWVGQDADIRFIYTADARLLAYINGQLYFSVRDVSLPGGFSGYANALDCPAAFAIGHDFTPPSDFTARSLAYVDRVDLHWEDSTDAESGVWRYEIVRDGMLIGRTDSTWYSDGSAEDGARHSYSIYAVDYFGNRSSAAVTEVDKPYTGVSEPKVAGARVLAASTSAETASVESLTTAVPSGITDGRRVGLRSTGTYYGAGTEQIDVLSGNLNYTFPLLKAVGRGSWGVTFGLSYNSQIWLKDALGTRPVFNPDVGYGLGWRLMAGSLTPKWDGGILSYYEFRDSSGAEYRLDQHNGSIWSSTEAIYVEYDETTGRLYFPDGSFWKFDCIAGGSEPDAGTRYPTLMQDTNGNQVFVRYKPALGTSTANTSARLNQIEDVRAKGGNTYTFTYSTGTMPHLLYINQVVGSTVVMWQIDYTSGYNLVSPFDGTSYGTTATVNAVCDRRAMLTHWIGISGGTTGTGELTSVAMPYSGMIRWDYRTFAFSGGATIREVAARYVRSATVPGTEDTYTLTRDDSSTPSHSWTMITDPTGASKLWAFTVNPTSWTHGLLSYHEEQPSPGQSTGSRHRDMQWAQDAAGNPYLAAVNTYLDLGTASQTVSRTEQTVDAHGNVLQTRQFDFNNLTTPIRTYTHTYVTSATYTSRHIWNLLASSTVTDPSDTVTLVTNTYDQTYLHDRTGLYEHDSAYNQYYFPRGNVTRRETPGQTITYYYDIAGSLDHAADALGHAISQTLDSTTNYAAPTVMTAASLNTNYTYDSLIQRLSATGPNSDSATV